ncbi:hypothetical protein [Limnohabitans sp.]|uniref:hypothetical protein n=1 Tax=Limnohabitans sp. TaxID=1907725 RepID=UPI00333E531D
MSCFVVNDYHVNALVAWGLRHGAIVGISPDALAHMLACANRAAYAERYQGDQVEPFEGFDRSVDPSHLVPVAVVKACDCLDYQCSDWSSWSGIGSEPAAHLAAIRAAALAMAMAGHGIAAGPNAGGLDYGRELPGYDAAAWHLDEPEPVDQVADRLAAALGDLTEPELAAIRSAMVALAAVRRATELARGAA